MNFYSCRCIPSGSMGKSYEHGREGASLSAIRVGTNFWNLPHRNASREVLSPATSRPLPPLSCREAESGSLPSDQRSTFALQYPLQWCIQLEYHHVTPFTGNTGIVIFSLHQILVWSLAARTRTHAHARPFASLKQDNTSCSSAVYRTSNLYARCRDGDSKRCRFCITSMMRHSYCNFSR